LLFGEVKEGTSFEESSLPLRNGKEMMTHLEQFHFVLEKEKDRTRIIGVPSHQVFREGEEGTGIFGALCVVETCAANTSNI
jgi:hypothetical protein